MDSRGPKQEADQRAIAPPTTFALAPAGSRYPIPLSPSLAMGWLLTVGALATFTGMWLIGLVATTTFFLLGRSGPGPMLVFAATGLPLGHGWWGMLRTLYIRLRRYDLDEPPAFPATFSILSPGLQRVARHARTLQLVLDDPHIAARDLDREMFEWFDAIGALPPYDQRFLADRGITATRLTEELVQTRWSSHRRPPRERRSPGRPRRHALDRALALAQLKRFEAAVFSDIDHHPFRSGRLPDPTSSP